MLLVNKENLKIASPSRIVKAEDVAAVKTACDLIAEAEEYAANLKASAKDAFEAERQRGYKQGFQEGMFKLVEDKLAFCFESAKYMENVEERMADVVLKALWKCVEQIGNRELIVEIIRKLMKAVIHNQRHVTLKVAPDMVANVRERINEVTVDYPIVEHVDIEEDARLKGTACIIETEAGIAEASIDTQIAAIESSIRKHFAREYS